MDDRAPKFGAIQTAQRGTRITLHELQSRLEALGYANGADYAEGKREWIGASLPMDRFRRSRSSSDAADAGAGAARMREAA